MKIRTSIILTVMLITHVAYVGAAALPGTCLSDEEAQLMQIVNDYRAANGLAKVAGSKSLSTVGQWHALDAATNSSTIFTYACNLHSWSGWKPSLWSAVCYTADHTNASLMWNKPKEITKNIYRGNGYELGGYGYVSVADLLAGWKNSSGHNAVLLNQGAWASVQFKAMGVGIDPATRYYYLWLGADADPQGEMPLCDKAIFNSGFEP